MDLTELPKCTVCLERMDESVNGILTTLCNHSFHSQCLQRWDDTTWVRELTPHPVKVHCYPFLGLRTATSQDETLQVFEFISLGSRMIKMTHRRAFHIASSLSSAQVGVSIPRPSPVGMLIPNPCGMSQSSTSCSFKTQKMRRKKRKSKAWLRGSCQNDF